MAQKRYNSFPCRVRTFGKRSCNQRVGCLHNGLALRSHVSPQMMVAREFHCFFVTCDISSSPWNLRSWQLLNKRFCEYFWIKYKKRFWWKKTCKNADLFFFYIQTWPLIILLPNFFIELVNKLNTVVIKVLKLVHYSIKFFCEICLICLTYNKIKYNIFGYVSHTQKVFPNLNQFIVNMPKKFPPTSKKKFLSLSCDLVLAKKFELPLPTWLNITKMQWICIIGHNTFFVYFNILPLNCDSLTSLSLNPKSATKITFWKLDGLVARRVSFIFTVVFSLF